MGEPGNARRLFGTDGIRDIANNGNMTPELALKLGRAFVFFLMGKGHIHPSVAVGKDTRRSGAMLESALVAGMTSAGAKVYSLGVFPTPGVSHIVNNLKLTAGAIISASHNPAEYNGIKFLDGHGFKLTDEDESAIEVCMTDDLLESWRPVGALVGDFVEAHSYKEHYIRWLREHLDSIGRQHWPMVIDAANGAASEFAGELFSSWAGPVVYTGTTPDGMNINSDVGVMHMEHLTEKVRENNAYAGIAYDGDTDRVLLCDGRGRQIDGDIMLWVIGRYLAAQGTLGEGIVATVMSNMALEEKLKELGIETFRCPVGDRYVLEKMRETGAKLGGEQSGHIIASDYVTTGDGLFTGLLFLKACTDLEEDISTLVDRFVRYPQVLRNLKLSNRERIMSSPKLECAKDDAEKKLAGTGRILLRPSGTEPLLRILVEARDEGLMNSVCDDLENAIMEIGKELT